MIQEPKDAWTPRRRRRGSARSRYGRPALWLLAPCVVVAPELLGGVPGWATLVIALAGAIVAVATVFSARSLPRVPLSAFGGVNLNNVRTMQLTFNERLAGGVLITDVAFASAP